MLVQCQDRNSIFWKHEKALDPRTEHLNPNVSYNAVRAERLQNSETTNRIPDTLVQRSIGENPSRGKRGYLLRGGPGQLRSSGKKKKSIVILFSPGIAKSIHSKS